MSESNSHDLSHELLVLLQELEDAGSPLRFDVAPMSNKAHSVVYTLNNGMELHVKLSNFFWFELTAVKTVDGLFINTETLEPQVRDYVPSPQTLINVYAIGFHQPTYITQAFWYEIKTLTRRMVRDKQYAERQMCSRQNRLYNSGFEDISSDYDLAEKRGLRQPLSEKMCEIMGLKPTLREDLPFDSTEDTSLIEEFEMLEIRDRFLRLENQISDEAFSAKMKAKENRDPNIQPNDSEVALKISSCIINIFRPEFSFYKTKGGSYKPTQLIALGEKLTEIYDRLCEVMRVPVDDYHFRLHELKQSYQLDTYNTACLSWIASAMKPAKLRLKKLIDAVLYTPTKNKYGVLILVLIDVKDQVHLVKVRDDSPIEIAVETFLAMHQAHEHYLHSLKKMFQHNRVYEPYDPTPIKVKSRWRGSESMQIPERSLFNMSNLEQRKLFVHLASVPLKAVPDLVSTAYNLNQSSKDIIWALHRWAEYDELKMSDIVRVNRIASLPASETYDALFISTMDRQGKIRVFDNSGFGFKRLTRRELAESIQFSANTSLEIANAVQILKEYSKHH